VCVSQRFSDSSHYVYSLAADDGTEQWRFETHSFVEFIRSPPTVADGTVYFGYDSNSENNPQDELGGVYALSATTGQQLWWQADPRDGRSSTVGHAVAVVDNTVYVGGYAIAANDGSVEWTGGFTDTAPAVSDGTVYCGKSDGVVTL
jgi:outer membrane protein assembly factor BamB